MSLVAALSLASIPLILGWRRNTNWADTAREQGLAAPRKRFDPDLYAMRTGTGATFNQLLLSFIAWVLGGLVAGLFLGILPAIVFAIAGGLLYYGGLTERKQEYRLRVAREIVTAMGTMETMLTGGKTTLEALDYAAKNTGVNGVPALKDLNMRLYGSKSIDQEAVEIVRGWAEAWENPAADMIGITLASSLTDGTPIVGMIKQLRETLSDLVGLLSQARAASQGIAWQAKFLAIFPPMVLVFMSLLTPEAGKMYATQPWYLVPVLVGSSLSYWLSMQSIRKGLSIDSNVGMMKGKGKEEGNITVDQMGRQT
jgi:Flp pilus assembly protein TadB